MDTSITFSAIQHAQSLSAILFPHLPSLEDQMISIRQRETLLAPREHWMSNVSEIQAPGWLSHSPRPLLWIGGRRNRRGISWVSSFTLDVVEALKMEPSVKVVYTLCDNAALMSQLIVFKHLIVQLLRAYPEILLVPENLNDLPVQRLAGIGDSTELAYRVLADIIRMVNQQCHRDGKEVFLLIDRVDVVLTMEDSKGKLRFLKALKQLLVEYRALRMILTSEYSMEEIEIGKEGREATVEIWVDTTKPVTMHSRQ
ncbi:uncharacterized protein LY89DRAFT_782878 [Mollisia scopiformis]|uniref:Uncharacterized protein n=1 Tax=Mollisia scopiformis TaxID=149040 RepID=A0A194X906_MOLSC|nr:uncharacterized protein LY89DRAFT_782878 [Mollisia scopiformis]KUJ16653.1 hypothetical protein LY89DRAFT_782878 [Mollisia scopiformis]